MRKAFFSSSQFRTKQLHDNLLTEPMSLLSKPIPKATVATTCSATRQPSKSVQLKFLITLRQKPLTQYTVKSSFHKLGKSFKLHLQMLGGPE